MIRFLTAVAFQIWDSRPDLSRSHRPLRILLVMAVLTACVTAQTSESKFGINPTRTGFVPARIALAPCIVWPDRAMKIKGLPLINRPAAETTALCQELSKYMADGFDNQPFMKGISQKLTEKLFATKSPVLSLSDSIVQEWKYMPSDCQNCGSLPLLYNTSIKMRPSWQLWLNGFSEATKGADALLIPLLLSLNTRSDDDRGMLQSIRSGFVAMILIDTNDGSLIWSGGRDAEVINKALVNTTTPAQMKMPPPEDLQRRLVTDALWLEFPGRQVYR